MIRSSFYLIWHKRKYNNKVEVEKFYISLVVLYLRFIFYFQEKIKMAKVAIIYYSQTGTFTSNNAQLDPDEVALTAARLQGKRVAELAAKFV